MDKKNLTGLSQSIVRALTYYDLFSYPLTSDEIFTYLPTNHVTREDVRRELHNLVHQSVIYRLGDFYSLQLDHRLKERRINGNNLAKQYGRIAGRQARIISRFPFIESVMVSGSLSKGYADENSDIDFFIVTRPGRLWIARTLLVLYKRLFLLNSHKFFCVNYFIDSDHLVIEERNRYTATELVTLVPLFGFRCHQRLLDQNPWLVDFFPNFKAGKTPEQEEKSPVIKRIFEWLINRAFPSYWDVFFMKMTLKRWRRLYGHYQLEDFEIAFKSNRHTSRNHPRNYQRQIVEQYQQRIRETLNLP